jgi:hypothetical protein
VKLAGSTAEEDLLLDAERDATSVLLNDWTHDLSDMIFAQYMQTGAFPHCVDSILANSFGRVECPPEDALQTGAGTPSLSPMSMSMDSMSMPSMSMAMPKRADMGADTSMAAEQTMASSSTVTSTPATSVMSDMFPAMASLSPRGCTPPMMFKPGFNTSSLPAETCTNTTSALLTIPANHTLGWLALNLVNSGAVSALRVSLDAHSMFVYAADGLYVQLQEVKGSIFSRLFLSDLAYWS